MPIEINLDFHLNVEEKNKLNKFIQSEILKQVGKKLKLAAGYFEQNLQYKLKNMIQQSPEFQELISGKLRYDLGITAEEAVLVTDTIPDIISKGLKIEISRTKDSISLNIKLIESGYKTILSMKEASFIQTFTNKTPYEIDWLKWLLLEGDKMIVGEYHVKYANTNNSRSGGAIMTKGGSWRVPPQFAGTENNNMITRALSGIDEFIYTELQKFL